MDVLPSDNSGVDVSASDLLAGRVSGTIMNEHIALSHRDPSLTEKKPTVETGASQNS